MKRIIAKATLVALMAATVAPVAQGNWAIRGFNSLAHELTGNAKFYACVGAMIGSGIAAKAYERFHKTEAQKQYRASANKCNALNKFIADLKNYDAEYLNNLNPNQKALKKSFNALAKEEQQRLQIFFDAYRKNANLVTNFTELLEATKTLSAEREKNFRTVYSEEFYKSGALAPEKSLLVTFGKAVGILGLAAAGLKLWVQAIRYVKT